VQALLDRLGEADQLDWERASLDSASVPAKKGSEKPGPNPTDKGKSGIKRYVVLDRRGIPLSVMMSAANINDSMLFEEPLDSIEPIKRPKGRPRRRPENLHADKAYDDKKCARTLRELARKIVESSQKLGRHRWVVEWALAWLAKFRRLTIRYERRDDIHEAFVLLGFLAALLQPSLVNVLKDSLRPL
jgi:transposase